MFGLSEATTSILLKSRAGPSRATGVCLAHTATGLRSSARFVTLARNASVAKPATIPVPKESVPGEEAQAVLSELGFPLSQAITLYHGENVRERGMPFPLRLRESAPVRNG